MFRLVVLYAALFGLFILLLAATAPPRISPHQESLKETPKPLPVDGKETHAEEGAESAWVVSGSTESIPLLIRHLRSSEEIVQRAALAEFAGLGAKAKPAVHAILGALRDPKNSIRVEAATTLIHLNVRTEDAVRTLTDELTAEDATARARAAEAIGQLVEPPQVLGICCWGPDPPPRIARPWVGKRTLPALVEALADRAPKVRAQAAETVGLIGGDAKPAVPALTRALKDANAAVRLAAARSLKRIDPAAAARVGIK